MEIIAPVRFHVVAHSDAPADQAVKLEVRDRVLEEILAIARMHGRWDGIPWDGYLGRLERVAAGTLQDLGFSYGARATWGMEPLGARHRAEWDLPGEEHPTLRIILGSGAGANWWCVLFPPLCFVDAGQGLPILRAAPAPGPAASDTEEAFPGEPSDPQGLASEEVPRVRFGLRMLAILDKGEEETEMWSWERH